MGLDHVIDGIVNRLGDLEIDDITPTTISPDFERNPKIHNCWLIRR